MIAVADQLNQNGDVGTVCSLQAGLAVLRFRVTSRILIG